MRVRTKLVPLSALTVMVMVSGLGCGASRTVRIGETREEAGGERACGSSAKRLQGGAHLADPTHLGFERRLGAARVTALAMSCAARSTESPDELAPPDEPAHPNGASRCENEAQCYDGFHVTGDAEADLGALADRCARACGMAARTAVHVGLASEHELPRVFAIELDEGACYRFFAVADSGIDVLAIAIADAAGNLVAIDNSRDRAPILGPRAPFCPSSGGRYRLVVAAARGAGGYVLQAWGRPRSDDDR